MSSTSTLKPNKAALDRIMIDQIVDLALAIGWKIEVPDLGDRNVNTNAIDFGIRIGTKKYLDNMKNMRHVRYGKGDQSERRGPDSGQTA